MCADIRSAEFGKAGVVVILDVLHYITVPEQNEVLARVRSTREPVPAQVRAIASGAEVVLPGGEVVGQQSLTPDPPR